MAKFNWDRARWEKKIRDRGGEPIRSDDRCLTEDGELRVSSHAASTSNRAGKIHRYPYSSNTMTKVTATTIKKATERRRPREVIVPAVQQVALRAVHEEALKAIFLADAKKKHRKAKLKAKPEVAASNGSREVGGERERAPLILQPLTEPSAGHPNHETRVTQRLGQRSREVIVEHRHPKAREIQKENSPTAQETPGVNSRRRHGPN